MQEEGTEDGETDGGGGLAIIGKWSSSKKGEKLLLVGQGR